MRPAVLFDLGNTLVAYYRSDEFLPILRGAVSDVLGELDSLGLANVSFEHAYAAATKENEEEPDFRFKPLTGRLERIFGISLKQRSALARQLGEVFLRRIFAVGEVYEDSLPVLDQLRRAGHPLAIVSNTPWGSPPELWRRELERLGLATAVDRTIFCGDVGWRKPARAIFEFAAATLDRPPTACLFAGDDPLWDVSGSQAAGMSAVLIDRENRCPDFRGDRIDSLRRLPEVLVANFRAADRGRRR